MSDQYLGQLNLVAFPFAPIGWALASGQVLPISSNTALFSLLGTYYGGNGTQNFALPNLNGAVAIGAGQIQGGGSYQLGQQGGSPTVTLISGQTPSHTHPAMAREARAALNTPIGNAMAESAAGNIYSTATSPLATMSPATVPIYGDGGPHNNMMPYLGMTWIIALQGIFPPRS